MQTQSPSRNTEEVEVLWGELSLQDNFKFACIEVSDEQITISENLVGSR